MKLNYFHNKPKALRIDIERYLERIHEKREEPTLGYLKRLHKSHLLHIPFENLDIHYKKKIVLDYQKIFEKIVLQNRGGFCYELNGLFYHLLANLGFDCYVISALVKNNEDQFGRDYDHMAIVVCAGNERWLVDVGFGKSFIFPKRIKKNEVQMDYTSYWRFHTDHDDNLLLQYSPDTNYFETKYRFVDEEKQLIQFMEMCEFHQTSSVSPFTQNKLITRLTEEGRVTLTDREIKVESLGTSTCSPIMNEDEFLSKLEQYFGITFNQLIPKGE